MNNLMKELIAEANRVVKLENEVKVAVTNMNNEVMVSRMEKLTEIIHIINELNAFFMESCPNKVFVTCVSGSFVDGNHKWTNSIRFGHDDVGIGIYFIGSNEFRFKLKVDENIFESARWLVNGKHMAESFVDEWTEGTRSCLEHLLVEEVRKNLQQRIEKSTADLKKANEKHEEYFKDGTKNKKDELVESYNLL